jgi:hypothetical protein
MTVTAYYPSDHNSPEDSISGAWVSQSSPASSGIVIYRSCAWGSDKTAGSGAGWGNQCSPISNCCTPSVCPDAVNWTDLGYNVEVNTVSCSGYRDSPGCRWNSTAAQQHPVVVGRVVRICEKK